MKRWLYVIYIKRSAFGAMRTLDIGDKGFPPPSDKERNLTTRNQETEINEDTYTQGNQFVITKKSNENENDIERVQAEMSSKINIKG